MYTLDYNDGTVLFPGFVQLATPGGDVDLRAQVSGAAVSTYSWDTSGLGDATSISGTATYDLLFQWLNNNSTPAVNTATLTVTDSHGDAESQTYSFYFPGTAGFIGTGTTTWPASLAPGAELAAADAFAAHNVSVDATSGALDAAVTLPAYNPNVPALALAYDSLAADPRPVIVAHHQLDPAQAVPAEVSAQLTFNGGTPGTTYYYDTSLFTPGDVQQVAAQADATALATGYYPYSLALGDVRGSTTTTTLTGSTAVLNDGASAIGAGWTVAGLEQITPATGGALLDLGGGGRSLWFSGSPGSGGGSYADPAGEFSTLARNANGSYTRTLTDGTTLDFNSAGYQVDSVTTNGLRTTFAYDGSNRLSTIQDPYNNRTTFTYSGGHLQTVTDPAGRVATFTHSGNDLTGVTLPDSGAWAYAYDGAGRLTAVTDPNSHTVSVAYDSAERVGTITRPDASAQTFLSYQERGWTNSGTSGSPAPATLLAEAAATYTDPLGNLTQLRPDWDGLGLTNQAVDPSADVTTSDRDANGLATIMIDQDNRITQYAYDGSGNPVTITYPAGNTDRFTYNAFSEPLTHTDGDGHTTSFTYDSGGNNTVVQDPLNNRTTMTYTGDGLLATVKDANSNVTSYQYDSQDRLTTVTYPGGATALTAYDSRGNATTVTDERGGVTVTAYDALNRPLTTTDALGNTTTFVYDSGGNRTAVLAPLSRTTSYAYDAMNRVTTVTDPLGHATVTAYDSGGDVATVTDPLGRITTYAYDPNSQPTVVKDPLGHATTAAYDPAGQVTNVTDPLSQATSYSYNADGWVTTGTDPLGRLTTFVYSATGKLLQETDPLDSGGALYRYAYDADDRLTTVTDPSGHTTTYSYDGVGNQTGMTDGNGHATSYAYDSRNRLTTVTDPLGHATVTGYDSGGNPVTVKDPLGDLTTTAYDALDRATTVTGPTGTTATAYDAAGRSRRRHRRRRQPHHLRLRRRRPPHHPHHAPRHRHLRLRRRQRADRPHRRRRPPHHLRLRLRRPPDRRALAHLLGRHRPHHRLHLRQHRPPHRRERPRRHPHLHLRLRRQRPHRRDLGARRPARRQAHHDLRRRRRRRLRHRQPLLPDDRRLLLRQRPPPRLDVAVGQQPHRPLRLRRRQQPHHGLAAAVGDGRHVLPQHDHGVRRRRPAHHDHRRVHRTPVGRRRGHPAGHLRLRLRQREPPRQRAEPRGHGHLLLRQRRTSSTGAAGSRAETYTYDSGGNRTMTGYATGTGNELTAAPGYTYTYDAEGNLTGKTQTSGGNNWAYTYDYRDRLTVATEKNSGGSVISQSTYTYDALNRRIGTDVDADGAGPNAPVQSWTVYDGPNPWADFSVSSGGSGGGTVTLATRYLYGPAVDQLLARTSSGGTTAWYLTDRLGTVRDIVNTTGSVIDHLSYDSYGNVLTESSPSSGDRFKFAGMQYDSATGLYFDNARYYDPSGGRFVSRDPEGFAAGDDNLYRYVGNAPTDATDPSGLAENPQFNGGYYNLPAGQSTPYMPDCGPSGGFVPPPVTSSDYYYFGGDWLDMAANIAAGAGDTVSAGLTSRLRTMTGIDDGIDYNSGYYSGGQALGTAINVSLTLVNPCTLTAGSKLAYQVVAGSKVAGNLWNSVDDFNDGNYLAAAADLLKTYRAISKLSSAISDSCFAAGTPLLTPDGQKAVEQFKPGDWVMSAPEDDAEAIPVPRLVEAVFQTYAPLLNLRVGGRTIRTTAEHPFWVRGRGWTAAHQMVAGDHLRSHDGRWVALEAVEGGQEAAPVYNMRIAGYHTYFVGGTFWGFSASAHNIGGICGLGDGPEGPETAAPIQDPGPSQAATAQGGLCLYKWQEDQTRIGGWQEGDYMIRQLYQDDPNKDWNENNYPELLKAIGKGNPIYDTHIDPTTGVQIPVDPDDGGFLGNERNTLEASGWNYISEIGGYVRPQ